MLLSEVDRIPDAALPLDACKAHLRLGVGFTDDGGQDGLILRYLRAAVATVEAQTSKALLERRFRLRLADWHGPHGQELTVGPAKAIDAVTIFDRAGEGAPLAPSRYRLEPDLHRAMLKPAGWLLPTVPTGGTVEVTFRAGFGQSWDDVPADLAQAVLLLAAQYHEYRQPGETGSDAIPSGVRALLDRWRVIRGLGARQ